MKILAALILSIFAESAHSANSSQLSVFSSNKGEFTLNNANVAPLLSPTTNVLYVAKNGSDTACNGSDNCPYLTIQNAINNAAANTTIYIYPGIYTECLVMRDIDSVAIFGSAEQNTTIQNNGACHTFSWVAGATTGASVYQFRMSDVTLVNTDTTNTYHSLHIDGNAVTYPNTFISDEADFNFVDLDGDGTQGHVTAYIRNAGNLYYTHGSLTGDVYLTNDSEVIFRQVMVGTLLAPQNVTLEYLGGNAATGLGRNDYTFAQQTAVFGNLVFNGHPIVQFDPTVLVVGNTTGTLTSYYASGKDYCPVLELYSIFGLLVLVVNTLHR